MGWKIVRDFNEKWCQENGVSGRWRTSPDPVSALVKKIGEEYGEFAENRDPSELYDLLDVIEALTGLTDPDGRVHREHRRKTAVMGGFGNLTEWTPAPAALTGEGGTDGG